MDIFDKSVKVILMPTYIRITFTYTKVDLKLLESNRNINLMFRYPTRDYEIYEKKTHKKIWSHLIGSILILIKK